MRPSHTELHRITSDAAKGFQEEGIHPYAGGNVNVTRHQGRDRQNRCDRRLVSVTSTASDTERARRVAEAAEHLRQSAGEVLTVRHR